MPIWQELAKQFSVDFDDAGSIGKRYRREDEIGTPYLSLIHLSQGYQLPARTAAQGKEEIRRKRVECTSL